MPTGDASYAEPHRALVETVRVEEGAADDVRVDDDDGLLAVDEELCILDELRLVDDVELDFAVEEEAEPT